MASRTRCVALVLGLALIPVVWEQAQPHRSRADSPGATAPAAAAVDRELASVRGIQAWAHILALSDVDDPVRRAPTLFVPSDGAMQALPDGMAQELVDPEARELRRAFLARGATEMRIDLKQIAGRRIQLSTLDGRLLVIDATGGEVHVGDAEAIEIRALPDGRALFILDDRITQGSVESD